jgi:transposase
LLSDNEILALKAEVLAARKQLEKQAVLLAEKEAQLLHKDLLIANKDAQIAWFSKMLLGQKRERFVRSIEGQLSLPFEIDTKVVEDVLEENRQKAEREKVEEAKKTRKKHLGRNPLPEHLEVVEQELQPEGDLTDMVCVGQEVCEVLELQAAKLYILRIVRPKYAPKSGEGSFKIAQLPERILNKSKFGDRFIVQILTEKYIDHMPVFRQQQRLAREGVEVDEATLYHIVQRSIGKLEILYDYVWQTSLRKGYLQVDETTIKVLESEKQHQSHLGYYWVYYDPIDKIPIFRYEVGRSSTFPESQLKDFKGFLQTDGYGGYVKLGRRADITHVSCWAHVRRKFDMALLNDRVRAQEALTMIQALYVIEREAKKSGLTPQQRKELRLEKSLPIVNAFFKWVAIQQKKVLPASTIGRAIEYAAKRYEALVAYMYNGLLEIDNNAIENSIRPIALGRKNYLFCKTHKSAQIGAMAYTFMAICKYHKVNPTDWLLHTLRCIESTSIQKLHTLLPQNFKPKHVLA